MTQYLIIPGLGNSGPEHWQTFFENSGENFTRVDQQEWDAPVCDEWIAAIDRQVKQMDASNVVMIGHSLGCTAIVKWTEKYNGKIRGAMLVAPSDLEAPNYTFQITGFTPIPTKRLPFKSIVVASEDDEWVSISRAQYFADCWGSEFVNLGKAGHINVASGYTKWEKGLEMLRRLS